MKNQEFKPFLLAVYGTLKKGHGNHRVIEHCEHLGDCVSERDYKMYSVNDWYPAVVFDGDYAIHMEVYKIEDQETADDLDRLEGYPDLYIKDTVDTPYGEATIYLYNMEVSRLEEVKSGNWTL